jgi:hypothetical protein
MFKELQPKQVVLMNDYPNPIPNPNPDTTSVTTTAVCSHCKNSPAEIFQENGEFCLRCWQEVTCPNV